MEKPRGSSIYNFLASPENKRARRRLIMICSLSLIVLSPLRGEVQTNASQVWVASPQVTVPQKGQLEKVGALGRLYAEYVEAVARGQEAEFKPSIPLLRVHKGQIVIDAVASGDPNRLRADLEALGLRQGKTFGSVVSGRFPLKAIPAMAALQSLRFARPSSVLTHTGAVTSQGDIAMRANVARSNFDVSGAGVTVGVLSDSFNQQGDRQLDTASGDLPATITVLDDSAVCSDFLFGLPTPCPDEGRAMMQLIYDVAPGAGLAFHTAFNGQADFASGIVELANVAGAEVIVDDVIDLSEPMFQDGIIAQAVDQVKAMGVSYFSAAGNAARQSYESAFQSSNEIIEIQSSGGAVLTKGVAHDFNPNAPVDILQNVTIPAPNLATGAISGIFLSFQWDQPFASVSTPPGAGSASDLDILLTTNTNPPQVCTLSNVANAGADPVEVLIYINFSLFPNACTTSSSFNIAILHRCAPSDPTCTNRVGPAPGKMKFVWYNAGSGVAVNEYPTNSPSLFGHANAAGAEAVGAAYYRNTPAFNQNPPLIEPFSAVGGTPILFTTAGSRLSTPEIRQKPEIVAPDGTDTTFFPPLELGGTDSDQTGYPNFFGTSAAAPHAAGVAALMLQAKSTLSPEDVYNALENTAINMGAAGFDFETGYGLVQADAALAAALQNPCTENADCNDGAFCNGTETCLNGICLAGTPMNCHDGIDCTTDTCNEGTNSCEHIPNNTLCNDGLFCNGAETCHVTLGCQAGTDPCSGSTCNESTDACVVAGCGDGVCAGATAGEDCVSCPADCIGQQGGKPSQRFCCGNSICEAVAESSFSCQIDCGPEPSCGDGFCNGDEDQCLCASDCGTPPTSEAGLCTDGINNDCDSVTDCSDSNCTQDPACNCSSWTNKTTCNAQPACQWRRNTCVSR